MINIIEFIFILIDIFLLFSSIFWMLVYLSENKPKSKNVRGSVAILIPAIYEGKALEKTIERAINIAYKDKQVYVVLNKDSTKDTIEAAYNFSDKIKVIQAPFNGKSKVMNYAIKNFIKEDYVMILDADTVPEKNIILEALPFFNNSRVASVVSSVKVLNYKKSAITWFQKYEYDLSILAREGLAKINSLVIAHGAGSFFRTNILKKLGYFDENNYTEDLEIGLRIQTNNFLVQNAINAVTYTSVPYTLKSLFKQRLRWYSGFIVNIFNYRKRLRHSKNVSMTYVGLPMSIFSVILASFSLFLIIQAIISNFSFIYFVARNPEILSSLIISETNLVIAPTFVNLLSVLSALLGFSVLIFMLYIANRKISFIDIIGVLAYVFIYNYILTAIWIYSAFYIIINRQAAKW